MYILILMKLPILSIKTFNGDPMSWPQFIETFRNVHENKDLTAIERFSYLKSYLGGDAERCLEGLSMTAKNYELGLTILEQRFGNKQLVISKHTSVLLALEKNRSSFHIRELRVLYDKVIVNLRALMVYKIDSKQVGPMLIPIILDKLPAEIKLEISRKIGSTNWELDQLMEILKCEIEARETCNVSSSLFGTGKINRNDEKELNPVKGYTAESLFVVGLKGVSSPKVCVFCAQDLFSDKCNVVTNVDSRKEFVRKNKLCFKCLGHSHVIKKCRSQINCFFCKSPSHHSASEIRDIAETMQ